jgi:hypothetical protein
MKRVILLLFAILFCIFVSSNTNLKSYNSLESNYNILSVKSGVWTPVGGWQLTNPNCASNCASLWYILYKFSEKDSYGRYQYCYVFQSNSRWINGTLANTGMQNLKIYVDSKLVSTTSYILAGAGTNYSPQAKVYFYVNPSDIKSNSVITFYAQNTYLN